jgi:glycosyltransferase involved in cell wall biosynthesis
MRVAVVHDWLTGMRGGERVLEEILRIFPLAEVFTLVHHPGTVSREIEAHPIHTSVLQRAPFARRGFRHYLPLFPLAVDSWKLRGFDLVISSSHCVAKAVRTGDAPHLCYCHTPMRYVWDQFGAYFGERRAARALAVPVAGALRAWDAATARRVHWFVANSNHVRERIRRSYGRDASVVYPPVDCDRFTAPRRPEDFYLVVSALVPYKRIDLAIAACARLGRKLVIVGDGPEWGRLSAMAGPEVVLLGRVSDEEVAALYSRCRALLFPGVEDFGITAVEAQAAGAPVVALGEGGVTESVVGGQTGVLFSEPTPGSMAGAIEALEAMHLDEGAIRRNASRFAAPRFREELLRDVVRLLCPNARLELEAGVAASAS